MEHTREAREARLLNAEVHTFDLGTLMRDIADEPTYREHGKLGSTLAKTGSLRVVLEMVTEGAALSKHRAPGNAALYVISGGLRFETGDDVIYLNPGELLTMPQGLPHSVEAVHASAFLLIFAAED